MESNGSQKPKKGDNRDTIKETTFPQTLPRNYRVKFSDPLNQGPTKYIAVQIMPSLDIIQTNPFNSYQIWEVTRTAPHFKECKNMPLFDGSVLHNMDSYIFYEDFNSIDVINTINNSRNLQKTEYHSELLSIKNNKFMIISSQKSDTLYDLRKRKAINIFRKDSKISDMDFTHFMQRFDSKTEKLHKFGFYMDKNFESSFGVLSLNFKSGLYNLELSIPKNDLFLCNSQIDLGVESENNEFSCLDFEPGKHFMYLSVEKEWESVLSVRRVDLVTGKESVLLREGFENIQFLSKVVKLEEGKLCWLVVESIQDKGRVLDKDQRESGHSTLNRQKYFKWVVSRAVYFTEESSYTQLKLEVVYELEGRINILDVQLVGDGYSSIILKFIEEKQVEADSEDQKEEGDPIFYQRQFLNIINF